MAVFTDSWSSQAEAKVALFSAQVNVSPKRLFHTGCVMRDRKTRGTSQWLEVLDSRQWRTDHQISLNLARRVKNLFSCEATRHTLSGSMPALSFSSATRNVPLSFRVVYTVNTPIMMKYLLPSRKAHPTNRRVHRYCSEEENTCFEEPFNVEKRGFNTCRQYKRCRLWHRGDVAHQNPVLVETTQYAEITRLKLFKGRPLWMARAKGQGTLWWCPWQTSECFDTAIFSSIASTRHHRKYTTGRLHPPGNNTSLSSPHLTICGLFPGAAFRTQRRRSPRHAPEFDTPPRHRDSTPPPPNSRQNKGAEISGHTNIFLTAPLMCPIFSHSWTSPIQTAVKDTRRRRWWGQAWTVGMGGNSPRWARTWRRERPRCRWAAVHPSAHSTPRSRTSQSRPGQTNSSSHSQFSQQSFSMTKFTSTPEAEVRLTFFAASSREFFNAVPSHLSILTGLSSIDHCNESTKLINLCNKKTSKVKICGPAKASEITIHGKKHRMKQDAHPRRWRKTSVSLTCTNKRSYTSLAHDARHPVKQEGYAKKARGSTQLDIAALLPTRQHTSRSGSWGGADSTVCRRALERFLAAACKQFSLQQPTCLSMCNTSEVHDITHQFCIHKFCSNQAMITAERLFGSHISFFKKFYFKKKVWWKALVCQRGGGQCLALVPVLDTQIRTHMPRVIAQSAQWGHLRTARLKNAQCQAFPLENICHARHCLISPSRPFLIVQGLSINSHLQTSTKRTHGEQFRILFAATDTGSMSTSLKELFFANGGQFVKVRSSSQKFLLDKGQTTNRFAQLGPSKKVTPCKTSQRGKRWTQRPAFQTQHYHTSCHCNRDGGEHWSRVQVQIVCSLGQSNTSLLLVVSLCLSQSTARLPARRQNDWSRLQRIRSFSKWTKFKEQRTQSWGWSGHHHHRRMWITNPQCRVRSKFVTHVQWGCGTINPKTMPPADLFVPIFT